MTFYFKQGKAFLPTDENHVDVRTYLPVGNYVIKQNQNGNLYFETVESFEFKTKLYGDNPRQTRRILDTFYARKNGTGVMLVGEKGSGKSLLAKMVSIEAAKKDVPTIIVNAPWTGDAFNVLLQKIEQPAIILFDEFEKVYDSDHQEQILTLLDGVFPTQKLFLFTCNNKWRIDTHMQNRPGRIYYLLEFSGVGQEFIAEYCHDNLHPKEHIPDILRLSSLFTSFNFDMLKALVEEMNRYGEPPVKALEMLNVRPEFDEGTPKYMVTIFHGEALVEDAYPQELALNPLRQDFNVQYRLTKVAPVADDYNDDNDDNDSLMLQMTGGYIEARISQDDLKRMTKDEFIFVQGDTRVVLTRKEVQARPEWSDLF